MWLYISIFDLNYKIKKALQDYYKYGPILSFKQWNKNTRKEIKKFLKNFN